MMVGGRPSVFQADEDSCRAAASNLLTPVETVCDLNMAVPYTQSFDWHYFK
jgi:hypothetical protein